MTARTFAFTKTTPYYRRHRALPVLISSDELTPEPVDMLITRYGDQGSRYYRPWDAYYHEGKFYRIVSHVVALDEDGKPAEYTHAFAPINDAQIMDRYPRHTEGKADAFPGAIVTIKDGLPLEVRTAEYGTVWTTGDGIDYLEDLLGLKATKRKSPRKAA